MVYFVKLQALFHGFHFLEKLNPEGAVLRFHHRLYLSENKSFNELKKSIHSYQNLFQKTLNNDHSAGILLTGLDMFNALHCLPTNKQIQGPIMVMDGEPNKLKKLNKTDEKLTYEPFSYTSKKFSLILAHGASIPDFEKLENLCQLLGKGQLYIKIETGNIAGLNQFEKLRLFFGTKKDVLVSTYPLNEESDIMLIEKKWA